MRALDKRRARAGRLAGPPAFLTRMANDAAPGRMGLWGCVYEYGHLQTEPSKTAGSMKQAGQTGSVAGIPGRSLRPPTRRSRSNSNCSLRDVRRGSLKRHNPAGLSAADRASRLIGPWVGYWGQRPSIPLRPVGRGCTRLFRLFRHSAAAGRFFVGAQAVGPLAGRKLPDASVVIPMTPRNGGRGSALLCRNIFLSPARLGRSGGRRFRHSNGRLGAHISRQGSPIQLKRYPPDDDGARRFDCGSLLDGRASHLGPGVGTLTQRTLAYTNHTATARSFWRKMGPLGPGFEGMLPRHLEIIFEINRAPPSRCRQDPLFPGTRERVSTHEPGSRKGPGSAKIPVMANLAIRPDRTATNGGLARYSTPNCFAQRPSARTWPEMFFRSGFNNKTKWGLRRDDGCLRGQIPRLGSHHHRALIGRGLEKT